MIDLWWLDVGLCSPLETVSSTHLHKGKALSPSHPHCCPHLHSPGLLASLRLSLLTEHPQHVHLSPCCSFMWCLSLSLSHVPGASGEQEACVSVLSGQQVVGSGVPPGSLQAGPAGASFFQDKLLLGCFPGQTLAGAG